MVERNKILSIKDLVVKFRVRSRVLTSIRNISFDIYDGETIAIVGESGSGKSVLTKTITNMLESNGYIANGSIHYYPNETAKKEGAYFSDEVDLVQFHRSALDKDSIKGIKEYNKIKIKDALKQIKQIENLNEQTIKENIQLLNEKINELTTKAGFSAGNNKANAKIDAQKAKLALQEKFLEMVNNNELRQNEINNLLNVIDESKLEIASFTPLSIIKKIKLNKIINFISETVSSQEIDKDNLSLFLQQFMKNNYLSEIEKHIKNILISFSENKIISKEELESLNELWNYQKRTNLRTRLEANKNLKKLRGGTIATIFQDPMTSLNPLLSVGYQICEVLRSHHGMGYTEAKKEAIKLMDKVGIPNAEKRFGDIPGKYSGGMRQRIVIAVALACKPKILICDEPTTALDVTIQAQILDLIKQLKEEYKFTVIFITHDLGVVANIADRVAVVYAGQIIEYGLTDEIFFDPKHPYTWALLSSLPQLGEKGDELFAITGTPPSLFNKIEGDAFAPRNQFALEIDYKYEPPMFEVTKTHSAKTWLLDPRSPKITKPKQLNLLKQAISDAKVGD